MVMIVVVVMTMMMVMVVMVMTMVMMMAVVVMMVVVMVMTMLLVCLGVDTTRSVGTCSLSQVTHKLWACSRGLIKRDTLPSLRQESSLRAGDLSSQERRDPQGLHEVSRLHRHEVLPVDIVLAHHFGRNTQIVVSEERADEVHGPRLHLLELRGRRTPIGDG